MAEQSQSPSRRESLQRVQIGLVGLGAVLLIVAFANIVAKAIRPDSASVVSAGQPQGVPATTNATSGDSEPLADLGVAPAAATPSVPDLQPDPRLRKPMDQDPKQAQPPAPQR